MKPKCIKGNRRHAVNMETVDKKSLMITQGNHKPNILILLSDQHAAAFTGCYGHPVVKTPNLDRLAERGVHFDQAYCPSPLCVPSRSAFMTGRRVQDIEIWDNNTRLPSTTRTWAHRLEAAGYETILSGRMHFNGEDKLHGFRAQIADDPDANESIPEWETGGVVPGHNLTLETMARRPTVGPGFERDDRATDAAVKFLQQRADQTTPWAMLVGLMHPHGPWNAEQKYWDLYDPQQVDLPPAPTASDHHPMHERNRRLRGMPPEAYPEDIVRRNRMGYYAVISRMDQKVGAILDALDRTGQRDNTIVVYTSDHGEMLGAHGLWMKSTMFDNSIRVPLVIHHPAQERPGLALNAPVSLLDLTASLCDWAGADTDDLAGSSIDPLLRGEGAVWHNRALVEFYATWTDRPLAAYIRGSLKLIVSLNEAPQLFDLASDPGETRDLAHDPRYAAQREEMRAELAEQWNPEQLNQTVLASQHARLSMSPKG